MLEPFEGKLSSTVLRGKGAERPLTYPVMPSSDIFSGIKNAK